MSDNSFFIPAHIWTPWFSVFGSKSGFDSLDECFGDLLSHIHALETGLSSDPPMNRTYSALDNFLLVSNSDAHSPAKLGREANIFDTELDYGKMLEAMIKGNGFEGTIEFFPEEGKYHFDGHRKCNIRLHPEETRTYNGICPSCGKPLTLGVLHRIDELSDRDIPKLSKAFYSLIPLTEILSEIFNCGPSTKKVLSIYEDLLVTLGPELQILMDIPVKDIEAAGGILLSKAIDRMRRNKVIRQEGYDGEYGQIHLFDESEISELAGQIALFRPKKKVTVKHKNKLPSINNQKKVLKTLAHKRIPLSDPILDPLNPSQREAVLHQERHLLIVAGPGTGKTMTLSHRIAYLIHSEQTVPEQILALTFTNKAVREMRKRIISLLSQESAGKLLVATFHGFCLDVLKKDGQRLNIPLDFTLCSEPDAKIFTQQVISESGKGKRVMSRFFKDLPHMKIATVMGDRHKNSNQELLPFFLKYQQKLRSLGMLDLDDLEVETLRLFQEYPEVCRQYGEKFQNIFVDEYQDTNPIQVELLKALIQAGSDHICVIGDPDQAIYGFRGADVENFYRFDRDFSGSRKIGLSKNYRSTQIILNGSSALLGREKPLESTTGKGEPILHASCRTDAEEAEMIVEQIEIFMGGTSYFSLDSGRVSSHEEGENLSFGDIAVLFRLNSQGDALEKAFKRAGIPYIRSGEKPLISRYPANIIWRFFLALHNPDNTYYLDTYLDLIDIKSTEGQEFLEQCRSVELITGIIDQAVTLHKLDCSSEDSDRALRHLKEMAEPFGADMGSFLDTLSLDRGIDHTGLWGDRAALMSFHAAKGLEWPVVFSTGCEDGLLPCSLFGDHDEEEEKRLLYVGMTRACRKLILSHVNSRTINGRALNLKPSPFLRLIPQEFCRPIERTKWRRKKKAHKQLTLF